MFPPRRVRPIPYMYAQVLILSLHSKGMCWDRRGSQSLATSGYTIHAKVFQVSVEK